MITQDNITLGQRLTAHMPKFFKTLRTVGITFAAIGGTVIAAPVASILATIGGYMLAAGSVAGAVSSLPVDFEKLAKKKL